MNRITIVLADEDASYIDSFSKFIRKKFPLKFNVLTFTLKTEFILFFQSNKADILIMSTEFRQSFDDVFPAALVVCLIEKKNFESKCENISFIYKYNSGGKIVEDVLNLYMTAYPSSSAFLKDNEKTKSLAFFSASGGCGKTTLSISLCDLLAKMGLRVLYLSLQSFSHPQLFLSECPNIKTISDIIFFIKCKKENISLKLSNYFFLDPKTSFYMHLPPDSNLEFSEISYSEACILLYEIKNSGLFDIIVIDTDSVSNPLNSAVIDCSDLLYFVTLMDCYTLIRLEQYKKDLIQLSADYYQSIFRKLILLINKYDSNSTDSLYSHLNDVVKLNIPFDGGLRIKSKSILEDIRNSKVSESAKMMWDIASQVY
jgi:cellulose biosynthesis protein BcsQ